MIWTDVEEIRKFVTCNKTIGKWFTMRTVYNKIQSFKPTPISTNRNTKVSTFSFRTAALLTIKNGNCCQKNIANTHLKLKGNLYAKFRISLKPEDTNSYLGTERQTQKYRQNTHRHHSETWKFDYIRKNFFTLVTILCINKTAEGLNQYVVCYI